MEQTNLEQVMEVIGQAVFDLLPVEDSVNNDVRKNINTFLQCSLDGYVLIPWPESQSYMEEEWFEEEAVLALGVEDKFGSSAYFIPIHRIVNS